MERGIVAYHLTPIMETIQRTLKFLSKEKKRISACMGLKFNPYLSLFINPNALAEVIGL